MKLKIFIYILCIILVTLFILITFRYEISKRLPNNFKDNLKTFILNSDDHKDIRYYKSLAYNQKKFPETQFEKLKLELIDLGNNTSSVSTIYNEKMNLAGAVKRFFIEIYNEKILIIFTDGSIFFLNDRNLIKNNFKEKLLGASILGTLIDSNDLYISYVWNDNLKLEEKNRCNYLKVAKATLTQKNLVEFKEIYKSSDCKLNEISGGKMILYNLDNPTILLTTDAQFEDKDLAQNNESAFGKILAIDLKNFSTEIFSKGHRNSMGLLNYENKVLATEHGPCGGDEINLILKDGNYGWPLYSYGDDYVFCRNFENRKNYFFSKDDLSLEQYLEPIFSFVPSIGISSIINIPNNFSKFWKNNFLIASLNAGSLYRVKFDKNYSKIIFVEKIFIGGRIVDIKYDKKNNNFLLALETINKVGILSVDSKSY